MGNVGLINRFKVFWSTWDFEFIIVDDGSVDQTAVILDSILVLIPELRFCQSLIPGLPTLTMVILASSGEWIARIDADDISDPTRLEKQLSLAYSDDSLVLIGSGIIDEFDSVQAKYIYPTGHISLVRSLLDMVLSPHSSALFYSSALDICHIGLVLEDLRIVIFGSGFLKLAVFHAFESISKNT